MQPRKPDRTLPEAITFWVMVLTWPLYLVGALYVVGPVLAFVLAGMGAAALFLGQSIRADLRPAGPVPPVVWAWIFGMLGMLFALWAGHIDWNLGTAATIKSSIGWAKGWALLALFTFAGAVLPIRRTHLVRAHGIVGLCTLLITPILVAAALVGLPERVFVSPLKVLGGPGPEYFTVFFYTIDPSNYSARWQFYAPWSPLAGLLGVFMVIFCLEDKNLFWKLLGVAAGVTMILLSKSRMGLVALVVCTVAPRLMTLLVRSYAWYVAAALTTSLAVVGTTLLQFWTDSVSAFKGARADSTRVRETLGRIAYQRWYDEAIWFGHGQMQTGPHIVEFMLIGSHHTWYGLLFVKGLLGFVSFLVPLLWQTWVCVADSVRGPRGRLPLGIVLVLIILTFGENIEIEVYLLWPAILMLGIHAREVAANAKPE